MNKRIFLIIALVIILTLLGIWAYILIYGTPEVVEDRFARFSSEQEDQVVPTTNGSEVEVSDDNEFDIMSEEDIATPNLPQQITTEPVAGYQFVSSNTTEDVATTTYNSLYVYYAELGTGHIYQYDLSNNQRDRLSNHTIQQTREAFITPDGTYAVLIRGYTENQQMTIIDLETNAEDKILLQEMKDVENISMTGTGDLLYTRRTNNGSVGYRYTIDTNTEQELFFVPLRNIIVAWAPEAGGGHYIYQAPSTQLLSTVYRVTGDSMTRTSITGYDMSLINSGSAVAYSYQTEINNLQSIVSEFKTTATTTPLAITIRKDKCDFVFTNDIICGSEFENFHTQEDWFRGLVRSKDGLWYSNTTEGFSILLTEPEIDVGRQVDLQNIKTDEDTGVILFQNRRDGTLWSYHLEY